MGNNQQVFSMKKTFFKIIVPNYNNDVWLPKCIDSVFRQSFGDFELIVVDDCSTDNSREYLDKIKDNATIIYLSEKRYNGGTRNVGLSYDIDSDYTLFIDSDDWLDNPDVLQNLHDFIVMNNYPDCIRLPFKYVYDGTKMGFAMLNDATLEKLVMSDFVACWTKCVKSDLVQPFPENTLMEDVVQHIKQCDVIRNVVPFNEIVIVHNKNNKNSVTTGDNTKAKKWISSMYRYTADLMDLELSTEYCKFEQKRRVDGCIRCIKADVYTQSRVK